MSELTLFYRPTCPYCMKVFSFMNRAGIKLESRNVTADPEALAELVERGGMDQVPCLKIGERYLYESDDIIAYLDANAR